MYKFDTKEIQESLGDFPFPKVIVIETTSYCNLKCTLCPQGILKRPKGKLSKELFNKIADEVSKENLNTSLWLALMGEPLLFPENLLDMIVYAKSKGIRDTNLNTNGLLLDPSLSKELIKTGLDKIILSIDGFKPETYESIRVGGKYSTLYSNIETLIIENRKVGNPLEIIAQFIVTETNEEEVQDFKNLWLSKGVTVKIRPKLSWGHAIESSNQVLTQKDRTYPCPWLIRTTLVHWNGKFAQCDADLEEEYSPGDLNIQTIKEVWLGELKKRRNRHWKGDYSHPLCIECRDWQVGRAQFYRSKDAN